MSEVRRPAVAIGACRPAPGRYPPERRAHQAEPCYDEALALYRADLQTEPWDLANAIRPLAILKERTGDDALAIALWQEAAALYAAVGVPQGAVESRGRLASLGAVGPQQAADG